MERRADAGAGLRADDDEPADAEARQHGLELGVLERVAVALFDERLGGESDDGSDELVASIRETVAEHIGKFARPKRVIWSGDLPKTRSGKIMRRLLRDIAEGRELGDVTTLRDPDVMAQLEGKIKERQAEGEDS